MIDVILLAIHVVLLMFVGFTFCIVFAAMVFYGVIGVATGLTWCANRLTGGWWK